MIKYIETKKLTKIEHSDYIFTKSLIIYDANTKSLEQIFNVLLDPESLFNEVYKFGNSIFNFLKKKKLLSSPEIDIESRKILLNEFDIYNKCDEWFKNNCIIFNLNSRMCNCNTYISNQNYSDYNLVDIIDKDGFYRLAFKIAYFFRIYNDLSNSTQYTDIPRIKEIINYLDINSILNIINNEQDYNYLLNDFDIEKYYSLLEKIEKNNSKDYNNFENLYQIIHNSLIIIINKIINENELYIYFNTPIKSKNNSWYIYKSVNKIQSIIYGHLLVKIINDYNYNNIGYCKYCGEVFERDTINRKYCDRCKELGIDIKLKNNKYNNGTRKEKKKNT